MPGRPTENTLREKLAVLPAEWIWNLLEGRTVMRAVPTAHILVAFLCIPLRRPRRVHCRAQLDSPGGVLPPASAMGRTVLERLRAAGMVFEVH